MTAATPSTAAAEVHPHPRPVWLDWALLVILGLGIALPGLGTLARLDEAESTSEKRPLATWPAWGGSAKAWRDQVQTFANDRFGGRETLVRAHSAAHLDLFGEPPTSKVVLGTHGWMYYGDGERGGLKGLRALTPERLAAWGEALDARQRWAAALGARYVLLIGPDKHTIYPEYLPPGYAPQAPTPFDQFLAWVRAERSDVEVLDVREALRAAKGPDPLYWPLDSHWTSLGAFVAAQAVVDAVRAQTPELAPLTRADVSEVEWPEVANDVACLLAVPERFTHPLLKGVVPRAAQPTLRLELCADSFGDALRPLLGLRFECLDPIPLDQAQRADVAPPDVVLDVMVERKFALDAPGVHGRQLKDIQRVEPALRFKSSPRQLLLAQGTALSNLAAAPADAVRSTDDGLELSQAGSVSLRVRAEALGGDALGWGQFELEVRGRVHRVELREPTGMTAHVLAPGLHALTFRTGADVEVRVAAGGGADLSARVTRLEIRGK